MRYLYLHGFASGRRSNKAGYFRQRFAEAGHNLEVLALDEGDFEHLTITGQLRVVERAARDAAQVTLIGSSLGGYLAALYAARHAAVERLVLLAPAFEFPVRWPERVGPEGMRRWKQEGALPVFHYAEGRERRLHYRFHEDAQQYEAMPPFAQPALILHGTRDDVVPIAVSEAFAAQHANCTLVRLEAGHELTEVLPQLWERTREFLAI